MAGAKELPDLIKEFVEMSKTYLAEETVAPIKRLGRYVGFSLAAAVAVAVGATLIGIALVRLIIEWLPEGPNWAAVGYAMAALVLLIAAASLVKFAATEDAGGS